MKSKSRHLAPIVITCAVMLFNVCLHIASRSTIDSAPDTSDKRVGSSLVEQLEALTYDARVKLGAEWKDTSQIGKGMAAILFDDVAVEQVNIGTLAPYYAPARNITNLNDLYPRVWPWPRFIHGQIVRELAAEGALAAGFDVMFPELSAGRDAEYVRVSDTEKLSPDEFFAAQLRGAGNVYLGVQQEDTAPADLFRTNALGLASIASQSDFSVLRRVRPFNDVRIWHPLVRAEVKPLDLDLTQGRVQGKSLIIPRRVGAGEAPFIIPLNANGTMKLTRDGDIDVAGDPDDQGPATELPFKKMRVWNLGIALAAKSLGLDLEHPELHPDRIVLHGPNGVVRSLPLDKAGYLYIDWSLRLSDLLENRTPVYLGLLRRILVEDKFRAQGDGNDRMPFKNKVVLIGSIVSGNNMTDLGATPLGSRTPLVTKHLNIANSVITGRFVERTRLATELAAIVVLGFISALLTWRMRPLISSIAVCGLSVNWILFATWMYLDHRYWIPIVMPVGSGLVLHYFSLVTYRMIFEEREQRRVRGIFSKIVSPDVVQELLSAEKLAALSGARRTITVFFADVRGFTEFTDSTQAAAEEVVQKSSFSPQQTRAYYDRIAAEQLATVNLYLATIADTIKKHRGTLDKYMGDCVMAFWGAPTPNDEHALDCVHAAIEAQRALFALNEQRAVENEKRVQENLARAQRGEPPLPLLPVLALGTGINTGSATVGLMGSDATVLNYTVFGREVNLASRLEGASGRGRILISEATYQELKRLEPALAGECVSQSPVTPKGFRHPIQVYEVPWKQRVENAPGAPASSLDSAANATTRSVNGSPAPV